jgi:hypothetical protein
LTKYDVAGNGQGGPFEANNGRMRARYTSPIPPAPRCETISYGPSLVPVESRMKKTQFSVLD